MKDRRIGDPDLDRRSGEDRREDDDLDFFAKGGVEKRSGVEARQKGERRTPSVAVAKGQKDVSSQNSPAD